MKKITLLLMAFVAMAVNAKTVEKTVWEGSEAISWNTEAYPGTQYETPSGTFTGLAKDNVVKIYTTTTYEDPNYVVTYKKGDEWSWTDLTTTITEGVISFTVADDTQATEIAERGLILRGQAWTATKITVTTEEADGPVDEGTPTELWSGTIALGDWTNFEILRNEGKGALANAKVGDDIRVTFTNATEGWQVYVCDATSYGEFIDGYFDGSAQEEAQTVSFRIANATVLEAIQDRGIVVKGKLVTLTKIEIVTYTTSYDAVAVTIGDDGIATFSSSKHLDFAGTGVTPYYASAVTTGTVTLTSTTTTWSWQGYILKGSANTYTVPVTAEANAFYPSTNYLKQQVNEGTVAASTGSTFHYIFAKKTDDDASIGFYKLTADHTLGAKKAYLETKTDITPTSGARAALIFDDDTTNGIIDINHTMNDGIYYNMNGMRIERPAKGLYIWNGKKIIIK
jgi:hypothetical protein